MAREHLGQVVLARAGWCEMEPVGNYEEGGLGQGFSGVQDCGQEGISRGRRLLAGQLAIVTHWVWQLLMEGHSLWCDGIWGQ